MNNKDGIKVKSCGEKSGEFCQFYTRSAQHQAHSPNVAIRKIK